MTERRLDRAVEYVSDRWFPASPELLAKIKAGMTAGVYDLDPEALLKDITTDYSLFFHCIRELVGMLREEGTSVPGCGNPLDLMRIAGVDRLREILSVTDTEISTHRFSEGATPENQRMYEAMLSASGAQVLAASFDVKPEVGFAGALMRQLGYTLVAWNYPSIYKEGLDALSKSQSTLDHELTDRLGFSPTMLGIKILRRWGVAGVICDEVFGDEHSENEDEDELDLEPTGESRIFGLMGGTVALLCNISEALARANMPEVYPSALRDWDAVEHEIRSRIGPRGLERIEEALEEHLESYLTLLPELFQPGLMVDPGARMVEYIHERATDRNPYLPLCSEEVRVALERLYLKIEYHTIKDTALRELVRDVLPIANLLGGYIYTIEPDLMVLQPQTRFGDVLLQPFEPVDYVSGVGMPRMISLAYRGVEPLVEYHVTSQGDFVNRIAGSFGFTHRFGVFYVEVDGAYYDREQARILNHFRALRIALSDCLGGF